MIPSTNTLEEKDNTLWWTNNSFRITAEIAQELAEELKRILSKKDIDCIIVDNQNASGTWPPETNDAWNDLMTFIAQNKVPCATIAASSVNKMHINRLSNSTNTSDFIQAFLSKEEAIDFVENLIKSK